MNECVKCAAFTRYLREMAGRSRYAMCEQCVEDAGVVLVDLPYDPKSKTMRSEIGTVGGFRWIKSDGTIGHLKDGETMEMPI